MGHFSDKHKPYTYIAALSILLVLLLLFGLLYPTSRGDVTDHIQFLVDMGGGSQLIRPTLEKDGSLICALPGNAAPEAITWHPDGDVLLNGTAVRTGDPVNAADGTLTYDGTDYPIRFFRGSTLPAMYIRTRTGNLKKIHQNKYNEEKAAVTLYRADGTLDCNTSRLDSERRGRGTSTC